MQTPLHSFPLDVTYATTEVHLWPVVSGSSRCQGLCISQELVSSEQLWLWIAQQSRSTSGLTSLFFICLAVTLPLVAAIFRQGSPQQRDHVLLFGTFCSTKLIVRSLCEKKKMFMLSLKVIITVSTRQARHVDTWRFHHMLASCNSFQKSTTVSHSDVFFLPSSLAADHISPGRPLLH